MTRSGDLTVPLHSCDKMWFYRPFSLICMMSVKIKGVSSVWPSGTEVKPVFLLNWLFCFWVRERKESEVTGRESGAGFLNWV